MEEFMSMELELIEAIALSFILSNEIENVTENLAELSKMELTEEDDETYRWDLGGFLYTLKCIEGKLKDAVTEMDPEAVRACQWSRRPKDRAD